MSAIRLFTLLTCIATASACQQPPDEVEETFNVDIRWTSHGIPHVKADNWGSLGYGFAYATATDAVCVIARDLVMVNGELSRYFGPADDNLTSDVFHKSVLTADKVAEFNAAQSTRANEFSQGYVAGYNRFLADHSESLPASCNKQPWVQPMQPDDVTRLAMGVGVRYGLGRFKNEIANAAPDGAADSAANSAKVAAAIQDTQWELPAGIGSNAVAVGSALSASGRGILLGNPHYPWHGSSRFHLIHTTIPGELDVMGTSLLNTTRVSIGFNKDVAWTHTVSTAMRFTLYQLKLNPDNPMQYEYDGEYRDIEPRVVSVTVGEGAQQQTREHTVYETAFGPIMENAELPWSSSHAYAIRDAVLNNYLTADTYDAMNKASSTAELEEAITRQGVYWVNTIGADRHGNAFYADISGTPNIDADLLDACRVEVAEAPERVVILDGSRSACEWRDDQRSRVKGALPPADMPRITTAQYVTNSNDSYWLTNPDQPLEGYSPIIGAERTARSLRTRAGLHMMGELLARDEKITPDDIQAMLYNHRNYGAELLLDDVLAACADAPAVQQACQALAAWDRTMNVDSRGGHLWREFWDTARNIDNLWAVPFDVDDPINTPRGINLADPAVKTGILASLQAAVDKLNAANIALDARLGDIQYAPRNGNNIGIPGGEGWAGMFSMIIANLKPDEGYTPIVHGNSYIQVISWDEKGELDPRAMLTYSQSPEPDSPYYQDLTQIYSQGGWISLPFTEAEIAADLKRSINLVE